MLSAGTRRTERCAPFTTWCKPVVPRTCLSHFHQPHVLTGRRGAPHDAPGPPCAHRHTPCTSSVLTAVGLLPHGVPPRRRAALVSRTILLLDIEKCGNRDDVGQTHLDAFGIASPQHRRRPGRRRDGADRHRRVGGRAAEGPAHRGACPVTGGQPARRELGADPAAGRGRHRLRRDRRPRLGRIRPRPRRTPRGGAAAAPGRLRALRAGAGARRNRAPRSPRCPPE